MARLPTTTRERYVTNGVTMIGVGSTLLTVGALSACAGFPPHAAEPGGDYPVYGTMGELCDAASVVIRGQVVGEAVEKRQLTPMGGDTEEENPSLNASEGAPNPDAPTVVMTIATVAVSDVLEGAGVTPGDAIEVSQIGGTLEGVQYETEVHPLTTNSEYVLFLATYPDSPANLLNPSQAAYRVSEQNTLIPSDDNTLARSTVSLAASADICAD